jgi:hypothetical protein
LSTYAYVGGNPLSFIDSNGLSRDKGNLGPLIGNILDKLLPPYNMQGDDDESDSIWGDGTRDHPSHDDEADALDTPLDATCEELAWAIGVLEAAIEWRKEKIREYGWNNPRAPGHRRRIQILQAKLEKLRREYALRCSNACL